MKSHPAETFSLEDSGAEELAQEALRKKKKDHQYQYLGGIQGFAEQRNASQSDYK